MLHLCNITTGVWGRYAGEDTRPFDAYSQQCVPFIGLECCCELATVCAKKKRGHFCPRNLFVFRYLRTMNTFSACTENGSRFAIALLVAQTTSTLAVMMLLFCNDCKRWRIALSAR